MFIFDDVSQPMSLTDYIFLERDPMEIVDQEIEKVLPAFRAAVHCELLTEAEVKQIVLARKKDEARLIKRECELTDYINFLHRDTMVLKLIGKVRLTNIINLAFLIFHILATRKKPISKQIGRN